jgi:hypothetical protein
MFEKKGNKTGRKLKGILNQFFIFLRVNKCKAANYIKINLVKKLLVT